VLSTYKFNIVIENTLVDDYVTEKFFEGLKSASLMVYLGGYHPLIQLYIHIHIMHISVAGGVLGRLPYSNPFIHTHTHIRIYIHNIYILFIHIIYIVYIYSNPVALKSRRPFSFFFFNYFPLVSTETEGP
jgi:hypothetical protein